MKTCRMRSGDFPPGTSRGASPPSEGALPFFSPPLEGGARGGPSQRPPSKNHRATEYAGPSSSKLAWFNLSALRVTRYALVPKTTPTRSASEDSGYRRSRFLQVCRGFYLQLNHASKFANTARFSTAQSKGLVRVPCVRMLAWMVAFLAGTVRIDARADEPGQDRRDMLVVHVVHPEGQAEAFLKLFEGGADEAPRRGTGCLEIGGRATA